MIKNLILLSLLFQIYTKIISLHFDHYDLNRAYFPIQFIDLKHKNITKSLNFNTYLSHSILFSEHFQIDPSLKGNDAIIPLEDNDKYYHYYSTAIIDENYTVNNYSIYIKYEPTKWISDQGLGFGFHFNDTSFSIMYQLKKQRIINKLQFVFEPSLRKGFLHLGGIPNTTKLSEMTYKGIFTLNETLPTWGFMLSSITYNDKTISVDTPCIIHSGLFDMIYSNEVFNVMIEIFKDEIDSSECSQERHKANGDYVKCQKYRNLNGSVGFSFNNNKTYIEIDKMNFFNNDIDSSFRTNPYKNVQFNKICILGARFLRMFDYSLFDYERKVVELYSNKYLIITNDKITNREVMKLLYGIILIILFNILLLLFAKWKINKTKSLI